MKKSQAFTVLFTGIIVFGILFLTGIEQTSYVGSALSGSLLLAASVIIIGLTLFIFFSRDWRKKPEFNLGLYKNGKMGPEQKVILENKVKTIVGLLVKTDHSSVRDETKLADFLDMGLYSKNVITKAIEDKLDIEITADEIESIETVRDLVECCEQKFIEQFNYAIVLLENYTNKLKRN